MTTEQSPWYAVYTKSRSEKKVYSQLQKSKIEAYLPLQKKLKIWSDRKKWVEEPLISSYVFVRIQEKEYLNVLNIPGIVNFVHFSGKAAPIPHNQIEMLQKVLNNGIEVEITDQELKPGDPVEIIGGSLKGICGELIEYKGNKKVLIKIEHVPNCFLINISPELVQQKTK